MSPICRTSSPESKVAENGKPTVIVLGTGIRGAFIAAFLIACGFFKVVLVDPFAAGCGVSSTNHGRFHNGVWNFLRNTPDAIERAWKSLELMRCLPSIWECSEGGSYCILHPNQVRIFEEFFDGLGKSFSRMPVPSDVGGWIERDRYTSFETSENSFNPAATADRLVGFARAADGTMSLKGAAKHLTHRNNRFLLTLSDERTVEGDVVVNTMGGWVNCLQSDLPLWKPNLMWSGWRLLCVNAPACGVNPLDHVVTIDRANGTAETEPGPLAAVPHSDGWVILGCDMPADRMLSQDDILPGEGWRKLNRKRRMDEILYASHAEHFPLLPRLFRDHPESMYTFSGVYPEIKTKAAGKRLKSGVPTPYKGFASWKLGGFPGYYPIFGGSATTAILDAKEACESILMDLGLPLNDAETWIHRIATGLSVGTRSGMIWEHRRTPCFSTKQTER